MKSIGLIALAALTAASQVWAVRVADAPPPSAGTAREADRPGDGAVHADDASSMREGVITGINDRRDEIEVNGSWLKVAAGTTRIFRRGFGTTPDDLAPGQKVRFTLAPGAADRLTLGAVYAP